MRMRRRHASIVVVLLSTFAATPVAAKDIDTFAAALAGSAEQRPTGQGADLYDALLGSWDLDVVEYFPEGERRVGTGEWHFARVLEGRAVQDVLVIPSIAKRSAESKLQPGDTYGTTVRVFRPESGTWAVTWFNPVTGLEVRVIARREGSEIVQVGSQADGTPFRWIFSELSSHSFRWRREVSYDHGKSWDLKIDIRARRQSATSERKVPPARD
jgi:hypothetical protein